MAAAATALLGISPTFDAVSEGKLLPVSIPPIAFAAAAQTGRLVAELDDAASAANEITALTDELLRLRIERSAP